jgi:histidine kinase
VGSIFSVDVPFATGEPHAIQSPTAAASDDAPLRHCRVWFVGGDRHVCEASRRLLERWDCDVTLSAGPTEALAAATLVNAPQILLLDAEWGDTGGFDLHPRLCERWGRTPATILITAPRDDGLRALALELGWSLLVKPVRPSALRSLMTQLLLRHSPPPA